MEQNFRGARMLEKLGIDPPQQADGKDERKSPSKAVCEDDSLSFGSSFTPSEMEFVIGKEVSALNKCEEWLHKNTTADENETGPNEHSIGNDDTLKAVKEDVVKANEMDCYKSGVKRKKGNLTESNGQHVEESSDDDAPLITLKNKLIIESQSDNAAPLVTPKEKFDKGKTKKKKDTESKMHPQQLEKGFVKPAGTQSNSSLNLFSKKSDKKKVVSNALIRKLSKKSKAFEKSKKQNATATLGLTKDSKKENGFTGYKPAQTSESEPICAGPCSSGKELNSGEKLILEESVLGNGNNKEPTSGRVAFKPISENMSIQLSEQKKQSSAPDFLTPISSFEQQLSDRGEMINDIRSNVEFSTDVCSNDKFASDMTIEDDNKQTLPINVSTDNKVLDITNEDAKGPCFHKKVDNLFKVAVKNAFSKLPLKLVKTIQFQEEKEEILKFINLFTTDQFDERDILRAADLLSEALPDYYVEKIQPVYNNEVTKHTQKINKEKASTDKQKLSGMHFQEVKKKNALDNSDQQKLSTKKNFMIPKNDSHATMTTGSRIQGTNKRASLPLLSNNRPVKAISKPLRKSTGASVATPSDLVFQNKAAKRSLSLEGDFQCTGDTYSEEEASKAISPENSGLHNKENASNDKQKLSGMHLQKVKKKSALDNSDQQKLSTKKNFVIPMNDSYATMTTGSQIQGTNKRASLPLLSNNRPVKAISKPLRKSTGASVATPSDLVFQNKAAKRSLSLEGDFQCTGDTYSEEEASKAISPENSGLHNHVCESPDCFYEVSQDLLETQSESISVKDESSKIQNAKRMRAGSAVSENIKATLAYPLTPTITSRVSLNERDLRDTPSTSSTNAKRMQVGSGVKAVKLFQKSMSGNENGTSKALAHPLTPTIVSRVFLNGKDLNDTPSNRYKFRTRKTNTTIEVEESSGEDTANDDDSSDGEWTLTNSCLQSGTSQKKGTLLVADPCGSEESDNESIDDAVVTLPKTCNAWKEKLSKEFTVKSYENIDVDQEESISGDECDWEEGDLVEIDKPPNVIPSPDSELRNPIDYFQYFIDEEIINMMMDFTNSYSTWKSKGTKCLKVTSQEMKQFLGIWMFMGVVRLPSLRDYWSTHTKIVQVSELMSFNRFQSIRAAFHMYDKADEDLLDKNDKYKKVSWLLNHMKEKCNSLHQENAFSIDETMVPYKGTFAGNLRQYIMSKPHKFGFKIFSLAGQSGLVYDFLIYAGSSTFQNDNFTEKESEMGVGAKVVIHLAKSIQDPENAILFFDNYFSSVKLISHLRDKYKILCTATIRSNRIDHCPLKPDKELKKSGRGSFDSKIKDGVQVIKWLDNRYVHVASTMAGTQPLGKTMRYDRQERQKVQVPIPRAVELYNANMGGVDLSNMLVELHRMPTRSRRWYIPLIGYMLDLAVVNSWLLYKRHAVSLEQEARLDDSLDSCEKKPVLKSKDFRVSICKSLWGSSSSQEISGRRIKSVIRKPRGFRPDEGVRLDGLQHWPNYMETQARCKYCCKGYARVICVKCNLPLCLIPNRNCFTKYHQV